MLSKSGTAAATNGLLAVQVRNVTGFWVCRVTAACGTGSCSCVHAHACILPDLQRASASSQVYSSIPLLRHFQVLAWPAQPALLNVSTVWLSFSSLPLSFSSGYPDQTWNGRTGVQIKVVRSGRLNSCWVDTEDAKHVAACTEGMG
eukprot:1160324-Pelagomonas_calceolata.AAC.6